MFRAVSGCKWTRRAFSIELYIEFAFVGAGERLPDPASQLCPPSVYFLSSSVWVLTAKLNCLNNRPSARSEGLFPPPRSSYSQKFFVFFLGTGGFCIRSGSMSPSTSPRFFTEREVTRHCTKDSCWVLLGSRVYDVTAFLRMHPGGEALILSRSGKDVSRELEGPPHRHSENARRWMEQYYIGELDRDSNNDTEELQVSSSCLLNASLADLTGVRKKKKSSV